MLLSELKVGEKGTVVELNNAANVKLKLKTMGIIKGVSLKVIRKAPFLDPIEIKVKDYYLAIRVDEAKKIIVVKNDD